MDQKLNEIDEAVMHSEESEEIINIHLFLFKTISDYREGVISEPTR